MLSEGEVRRGSRLALCMQSSDLGAKQCEGCISSMRLLAYTSSIPHKDTGKYVGVSEDQGP